VVIEPGPRRWYCPEHEISLPTPTCRLCALARIAARERRRSRRVKQRAGYGQTTAADEPDKPR
jgi:hypothetical protein